MLLANIESVKHQTQGSLIRPMIVFVVALVALREIVEKADPSGKLASRFAVELVAAIVEIDLCDIVILQHFLEDSVMANW